MFGVAADVAAGSVASIASNLASKNRPQVQQQQQQHSSPSSPLHQSSDTESAASPIPRETWTPKMIPADPPLAKFLVTKVRSFRPAYQRIIALHRHHLMTIETENFSETNRYPYASILRVTALVREEDALLLELAAPSGERIKFRCSRRPALLTEIHRRKFCSDAEMVRAARGRTELPTAVHDAAVAVIGPDGRAVPTFVCERQRRMGGRVPCQLVVLPHAVREVTIDGMHVLQEYKYIHIDSVGFLSDNPHGIILYVTGRGRLFFLSPSPRSNIRSDLASALKDATESLGTSFVIGPGIPWTDWIQRRSALGQDAGTPVCVHRVTKCTPRHPDLPALRREVAVTPTHVVERDPGAVAAVSCRSLTDLHALVRLDDTSLRLEYTDGQARTYASPARDALACSILDCCLSVGHKDVAVTEGGADGRRLLPRGQGNGETGKSKGRLGELFFGPDTVEAWHLKRAGTVAVARMQLGSWAVDAETCCDVAEACADFNANVPLTGISHSTDKRTTVGALYPLCRMVMTLIDNPNKEAATDVAARSASEQIVATLLQSIFRIVQCPAGFMAVAEMSYYCPLFSSLLKMWDSFALYWAVRTLGAVMKCGEPRNREQEFVNKQLLLSSPLEILHALVALLIGQGGAASSWSVSVGNAALPPSGERSSDLLLMAASEVIESILCGCYDTTAPPHFDVMITSLSSGYGALMEMLRSTCAVVVENAALLLQIISRHRPEVAVQVREAALSSATLLRHLYLSIFSPADSQRFLSRFLVSTWMEGPPGCDEKRLLGRILPEGFLPYLAVPPLSDVELEQLDAMERGGIEAGGNEERVMSIPGAEQGGTNVDRLRGRIQRASAQGTGAADGNPPENFRIFFHVVTQDHNLPDLLWNQQTRRELRVALEGELQSIDRESLLRGGGGNVAWNHRQFAVRYPSLRDEVHVGSIYMRLWLEAGDAFIKSWENPEQLFELLFRRLLCDIDRDAIVSNMCIRCLERLYKIHSQKIGVFQDVMILVRSMALTSNIECQHRILSLLATLLGVAEDEEPQEEQEDQIHLQGNAEQLLNAEAISLLCQYTAWGHTNDAQVGNLLSEVSRVDNAYTMITDGTNRSPFSSPPTASAQAPTATGPKVWFTAPPGIIPPPAGIQGPFTIADLKAQMQTSRLYPHSLVTCSHVGDYSADASVSNTVQEHAMDTGKWRELKLVWQLRWQLCTEGTGVHGPSTVARTALRALSRLVDLHPSVNSMGVPYHPIPTAKRLLCGLGGGVEEEDDAAAGNVYLSRHDALAVVAQSLLQNDHGAVTAGAKLLYGLMLQNEEAASKLYLSGAFVFALAYTGSNFYSVAELLDVTHLCQNFQAGASAAAGATDLPLLERSILGNLLPAGLLHVLVNYGSKKFAEVFVGEYDTPEIIWTFDMRRHLVAMIQQHLGDFPQRLRENTTAKYEYCPVPGINYRRLDREIFCHNYYLHSLCDQVRFKDWPVEEPVEVFRACLENLKQELCRDQVREETAQEEARKTLRLEAGDTGDHLRKAYRKLARQYHPDKNPGGRDMFEKIKGAYELLLPVVEGGGKIQGDTREARAEEEMEDGSAEGIAGGTAALHALGLLIKTQVLLCQRYPEEIGVYKYPAYSMLLLVLQIPTNRPDCIIQTKRAEFIKSAVELMFQTCLVSPLNAEELVSEGGVPVLATLLHHFVDVLRDDNIRITLGRRGIATINVILTIITHIVHTLSGISYFEPGRTAIVSLVQQDHATFCIDWVTCISGKCWGNDIPLIKKYALEGAANLARNRTLQHALVDAGIPWPLVRCMLSYDPSLEGVAAELNETDVAQHHTSQAAANVHAQLAARALGMLCGVTKGSLAAPKNAVLYDVMVRLLTRPLAKMLRNRRPQELLRSLNANVRTPCRIWNIEMRSELLYFIDGVDGKDPPMPFTDIVTRSKDFSFDSMKGEIIIGGVYIRLFIGMGGGRQAIQEIENCQAFGKSLIKFIKKGIASYVHDKDKSAVEKKTKEHFLPVTDERFAMAVRALHQLVALDDLIDDVLCSDEHDGPAVLLSLLELPHDNEAYEISFEIIKLMAPKQRFANAVAQQGELWRLLQVLERPNPIQEEQQEVASELVQAYDRCHRRGWLVLESLASSTAIATVLAQTTGWIELLGILVGYSKFTKRLVARQGAAKTLASLLWDPQVGPQIVPRLGCFLPPALINILKNEGIDSLLRTFDNDSETPELIWRGEMRSELRAAIGERLDICLAARNVEQKAEGEFYQLPPGFYVQYAALMDELCVSGIYVRLFLKDPKFKLRDPCGFLEMIMQRWAQELRAITAEHEQMSQEHIESVNAITTAKQDVLKLVTSASVFLCKIHPPLCDKLSLWGYMTTIMEFMCNSIRRNMMGTPLLSTVRLLHVSVTRRTNVEALSLLGEQNGRNGVIDLLMQSIGEDPLNKDCAFIAEVLKNLFKDALGDVYSAQKWSSMSLQQEKKPSCPTPLSQNTALPSPPLQRKPQNNNENTNNNLLDPQKIHETANKNSSGASDVNSSPESPLSTPSQEPPSGDINTGATTNLLNSMQDTNILTATSTPPAGMEPEIPEPDPATILPSRAPSPPPKTVPVAQGEGSGIDARSSPDAEEVAHQNTVTIPGAPGSAHGRVALLSAALACNLPMFLVENVLMNPTLASVTDPAAMKVHSVELLKLLCIDPGYGMKFQLVLDSIPEWKRFKTQDHSLFITGAKQKVDYFLTNGNREETRLLTQR